MIRVVAENPEHYECLLFYFIFLLRGFFFKKSLASETGGIYWRVKNPGAVRVPDLFFLVDRSCSEKRAV